MSSARFIFFIALAFVLGAGFGSFLPQYIFKFGALFILIGVFFAILSHRPAAFLTALFLFSVLVGGLHSFFSVPQEVIYQPRQTVSFMQPAKERFLEVIQENFSPPRDEIVSAMLLGESRAMSFALKEKLDFSGLRHLTAISGLHITLLTLIFLELFLFLGFWRNQSLILSILVILAYILLIGAPPSAVRAGIMGGFLALAQAAGRLSESGRAIVFAAALMLILNPLLVKNDIGFQLSFAATLGIVYLTPVFQSWLKVLPEKEAHFRSIISMTLSAQIFTLPLLIYHFGYISISALLSNILVLPLLPPIMILSLLFLVLGAVFAPLGWLVSLPLGSLISYMVFIIDVFSSFSLSAVWFSFSASGLVISYIILAILTWHLKHRLYLAALPF